MVPHFNPPFLVENFGGLDGLAKRVAVSQRSGHPGSFTLTRTSDRQNLMVMFVRRGMICRYVFDDDGQAGLALRLASVVCAKPKFPLLSLGIEADADRIKVTVTYDQERGYSLRLRQGRGMVSDLSLPFAKGDLRKVAPRAIHSYVLEAGILASWSVLSSIALARSGNDALGEILDHERKLCWSGRDTFDSLAERFNLSVGSGVTALALPTCRIHWDNT